MAAGAIDKPAIARATGGRPCRTGTLIQAAAAAAGAASGDRRGVRTLYALCPVPCGVSPFRIQRDDGVCDGIAGRRFSSYDEAHAVLERYYGDLCCSDEREYYRIEPEQDQGEAHAAT